MSLAGCTPAPAASLERLRDRRFCAPPQFTLRSGEAKLSMRGSLLSDKQDATILLNDFPMHTLRPLFRCVWGGCLHRELS